MPRPTVPAVAENLYAELVVSEPGDAQRDWPLLKLLGAVGTTMGRLAEIVRDTDDGLGWTSVLDPDRAPAWALPWLAQFAGVRARVDAAPDEATKRALITAPPAFLRGTRAGMTAAVAATLTGSKTVTVLERVGGDPYALTVIVRTSETPNTAATLAAAMSQKPIGLILTLVVSNATVIDAMTGTIDSLTGTIDAL